MTISKTLTTSRLVLRPLQPHHIPDLHKMYSDTQTMRFMPSLPHTDVATTEQELAQNMSHSEAYHWVICLKQSEEPIGVVNYLGGTRVPGLGYVIRRDFGGRALPLRPVGQPWAMASISWVMIG